MTEPVLIRIGRARLGWLSAGLALLTLWCLGFSALVLSLDSIDGTLLFIGLLCAVGFGWLALFCGGVALSSPVALRMDQHGISGFYTEPVSWHEISGIGIAVTEVNVHRNFRNQRHLGFALHDPVGFRDRQSAWRRLTSWLSGRTSGYHITVPELVIKGIALEELLEQARAMHAQATASDQNDPTIM